MKSVLILSSRRLDAVAVVTRTAVSSAGYLSLAGAEEYHVPSYSLLVPLRRGFESSSDMRLWKNSPSK